MKNPSVKENMEQLELSHTNALSFKLRKHFQILFDIILEFNKCKSYGLEMQLLSTDSREI